MITAVDPGRYFHVTVEKGQHKDAELSMAVDLAVASAQSLGWMGVMVTRHSPTVFTVALSENVPYGVTAERDAADTPK
ncbi:hypothetical protein ACHMXB_21790 (plasmid) [Arthrobacter sp. UC242_113]|uniref:hypothetical protein n=1 Tax=Arthrobacter sp. UC242_113 TaxID=3374550 RepID=UPI0037576D0F